MKFAPYTLRLFFCRRAGRSTSRSLPVSTHSGPVASMRQLFSTLAPCYTSPMANETTLNEIGEMLQHLVKASSRLRDERRLEGGSQPKMTSATSFAPKSPASFARKRRTSGTSLHPSAATSTGCHDRREHGRFPQGDRLRAGAHRSDRKAPRHQAKNRRLRPTLRRRRPVIVVVFVQASRFSNEQEHLPVGSLRRRSRGALRADCRWEQALTGIPPLQ